MITDHKLSLESTLPTDWARAPVHKSLIELCIQVQFCGKYTDTSKPPLYGVVKVLNPFAGSWMYARNSLYSGFAMTTLSAMTIAP